MYLRERLDRTLEDVLEGLESGPGTSVRAANGAVTVNIMDRAEATLSIRPARGDAIDVGLDDASLTVLAGWLDVPKPFLLKADPQLQETILNYLLNDSLRSHEEGIFRVGSTLTDVRRPGQKVIEPRAIIEVMQRVIDPKAPVIDFWANSDEFRLDTVVPEGFERGVGGDPQVGDLTTGGIRVIQNRKLNHAPQLAGLLYRLVCTNGMHFTDTDLTIDARGQTVEDVMAEIDSAAHTIMSRIEGRIDAFYALRDEQVVPEQTILRVAAEQGISPRVTTELLQRVPSIVDEDHHASMFDVVNLITNQANDPSVGRAGSRLVLERAGGETINDHAERCGHCRSRLL